MYIGILPHLPEMQPIFVNQAILETPKTDNGFMHIITTCYDININVNEYKEVENIFIRGKMFNFYNIDGTTDNLKTFKVDCGEYGSWIGLCCETRSNDVIVFAPHLEPIVKRLRLEPGNNGSRVLKHVQMIDSSTFPIRSINEEISNYPRFIATACKAFIVKYLV